MSIKLMQRYDDCVGVQALQLLNTGISDGAFRLLVYLNWVSQFSIQDAARCLDVTRRTIRRRLQELEEAGYISQWSD